MNRNTHEMLSNLERAGISPDDARTLRRISMTLHRWYELECGDGNDYASWAIERDEKTGKPYLVTHPHTGESHRAPIPDKEKGALRRLAEIIGRYEGFAAYQQTDPRGCALYILRPGDIPEGEQAERYYTNGLPVYK